MSNGFKHISIRNFKSLRQVDLDCKTLVRFFAPGFDGIDHESGIGAVANNLRKVEVEQLSLSAL